MKILVTGANGFIGKNLIERLRYLQAGEILEYDRETDREYLEQCCHDCNFVYHLAGVNRPERQEEYQEGNFCFTSELLGLLKKNKNICPIVLSSSIQAEQDNPYGRSKRASEELLKAYGKDTGAKVLIYRFPNVFGKWCRPNYNSVVATFCHNITHGIPIQVNGRETCLQLVYIDDVVTELIHVLNGEVRISNTGYGQVQPVHQATLGEIADLLETFQMSRRTLLVPDMTQGSFSKKLYSTYLSYLPENEFLYPLKMNRDERGSFTEILRTMDRGQFSVNITKPGIEKGNHWHNTKNEKFVVVSGNALIQFRKPGSNHIISYRVSGERIEVVDIPVGYTHNIINEGCTDLVTFMWCNECFDSEQPDTYYLKVNEEKK